MGNPSLYGYNQVLEQVFQAHERRMSDAAETEFVNRGWVDPRHRYDSPADRLLDVSFHLTPQVGLLLFIYLFEGGGGEDVT